MERGFFSETIKRLRMVRVFLEAIKGLRMVRVLFRYYSVDKQNN
jgi:hypothetical protein